MLSGCCRKKIVLGVGEVLGPCAGMYTTRQIIGLAEDSSHFCNFEYQLTDRVKNEVFKLVSNTHSQLNGNMDLVICCRGLPQPKSCDFNNLSISKGRGIFLRTSLHSIAPAFGDKSLL